MPIDYDSLLSKTPQATDTSGTEETSPSYMQAADNHNYGNGNFAITNPTTWGSGLENAGKFIVVAAASGLNSFYNTGVTVGNWLGADGEQNDIGTQLAAIDDDLGKYYYQNKESADMAGFVLSSFVPGIAGVKLLNAGQKVLRAAAETGMVGSNLSRVTGLLAPSVPAFRTLAATEIAASGANFSALTANTIKAIGAGYGQAALESAAFEIAVEATSFKSPVLNESDGWDIAKNMMVGTLTGGVIGGAINHAITYGAIKTGAKTLTPAEKLFTDTTDVVGLTPAQRIIARGNSIVGMPIAPTGEEVANGLFQGAEKLLADLGPADRAVAAGNIATKFGRMREEAQTSMALKNRGDFHELSNGDKELGNQLADFSAGLDSNTLGNNLEHLTSVGRLNTVLDEEKLLVAGSKKAAKLPEGEVYKPDYTIGYVKLSGEDAGTISFTRPSDAVTTLGDKFGSTAEVNNFVAKQGFTESKLWSAATEASKPNGNMGIEARYLWAERAVLKPGMVIGEHDIPLLEKAITSKLDNAFLATKDGDVIPLTSPSEIYKATLASKESLAAELLVDGKTVPEIAKITNVRASYLEGEVTPNPTKDLFARQSQKADYVADLEKKGLYSDAKAEAFHTQPTYAKTAYDTKSLTDTDGMELAGMAYMKAQQKMYQVGIDNAVAAGLPNSQLFERLYHPGDDVLLTANRFDGGARMFSSANGTYGGVGSWTESIGSATSSIQKDFHAATSDKLQSSLYKVASKQEVAVEWSAINKTLQSTAENYGISADGTSLRPLKLLDYEAKISAGESNVAVPILQEGAPATIPIKSTDTLELLKHHTELDGNRTISRINVRAAQGLEDTKDARAVRPIRPNPKDYPFYAMVEDPTISGVGHTSMIHATSAKDLETLITKVPSQYKVYTGDQLKQWHQSHGDWDWSQSLHENYIDADLSRTGANNPFFVQTDPQKIAKSILDYHLRSDDNLARELVSAKFEKEFTFLRQQGEQATSTASSRYTTNSLKDIEKSGDNPYFNYIKTALNISQGGHYPRWQALNQALDSNVSTAWSSIKDAWNATKNPNDLIETNRLLNQFGVKTAYYDAATELLANHTAPRGVLTGFVQKANSMLSTLVTRTDPFNAINNAVGATVLYGTELKSVLRAMGTDDSELVGKLKGLLYAPIPSTAGITGAAGTELTDSMLSAGKILRQAVANFHSPEATTLGGVPLKEYYKNNGWASRLTDQYHSMLDDVALKGTETVTDLNSKLNSMFSKAKELGEAAEKYSGNKLAEEFNRFVAADSMRQITDLGVQAGKLTEQEATSYINTFVNRTQGNILASQRPLMFQGAIGQAIGLFQSYQFNMMQQLFRHVAEGTAKDSAMLLGLQGTMYGLNGLPAFNFLNTHIIGTASGNPNHQDAYSTTYGITGKNIGDLLLYGLPSNLLRANLYTRGDINPRQVTVVPTNPLDIPFVNAVIKTTDNLKQMLSNTTGGGSVWESLLQGIEHNGLSRPLAGLAQTLQAATHNGQVFSTTTKGNISGANDLFSWATATRLAGAKPIDDAIGNDAAFRYTVYQAADHDKMNALGEAMRTSVVGGGSPSAAQVNTFAAKYAELGGKQQHFNKFMIQQIKTANTSKANMLMENLKNPYSQKMQEIMGGTEGLDGRSFTQ